MRWSIDLSWRLYSVASQCDVWELLSRSEELGCDEYHLRDAASIQLYKKHVDGSMNGWMQLSCRAKLKRCSDPPVPSITISSEERPA